MPKYTVIEIWTRLREIEATADEDVYLATEPDPKLCKKMLKEGFALSNWHVSEHK